MQYNTFNILSLAGGGIKGIFQASFLRYLQDEYQVPLSEIFDLVAGTSTGSILAACIAMDINMKKVVDLYCNRGKDIFKKRFLRNVRENWYSNEFLKKCLEEELKDDTINQAHTKLLIPSTNLESFKHVIFTNEDDIKLVDAVMASSAAPFYFKTYKGDNSQVHYMDGGLWANDPTLVAILYALTKLEVPLERIHVLSIGNKCMPSGIIASEFDNLRTIYPSKIKTVINAIFNASESFAEEYSKNLLKDDNIITINPEEIEHQMINMDDVDAAKNFLPAIAENLYKKYKEQLISFLGTEGRVSYEHKNSEFITQAAVLRSGLADFVPSRDSFSETDKARTLKEYLEEANESIRIIGISLNDALNYHDLENTLIKLKKNNKNLKIKLSLLDFTKPELLKVTAEMLQNKTPDLLEKEIKSTASTLFYAFRSDKSVEVVMHSTMSFGTTIVIDEESPTGSMIIEAKPFKAASTTSFSYKLLKCGESELFENILKGLIEMDKDSTKITKKMITTWNK